MKFAAAHDCGKVINPVLVEGQACGAIAFGIGGILSEEIRIDAAGRQLTNSFADYVMPRALDVPTVTLVHHDSPNPVTDMGLKGAGAAGVGGRQVHNRGTLGGNVVAMHPLYDILPPLLALGAETEILDPAGSRRVPLAALLTETRHGLGSTALMLRVRVRSMSPRAGWAYEKLKMTDGSYGSANAAAVVTMEGRRLTGVGW